MALISVQNLMAPFENKTHLFSICVVAAVFGLWRATGGSVSVQPLPHKSPRPGMVAPEASQPAAAIPQRPQGYTSNLRTQPSRPAEAASPSNGANELDRLLRPSGSANAQQAAPPAQPKKSRSALDDIEKTLGMR